MNVIINSIAIQYVYVKDHHSNIIRTETAQFVYNTFEFNPKKFDVTDFKPFVRKTR